ncbi:E3 ubiquitin-protein ligase, partial [Tetrabaena socialis]
MGFTLTRYLAVSVLAASAVVYHAFATRQYFYRSTIYLASSKIAVAAMGNLAFALALCAHQVVIKLFLGSLRDIEQEMIRERLSSAVMESLLALTIFREEFSTFFVAMFASLVFVKVMHWLVQDRVDYVEVTPTISLLGHARIVSFMALLLAADAAFLQYTIAGSIQSSGQSVQLLFAFEYVILASTIVRYGLKYGMSMADLAMDGTWTVRRT